MSSRSYPNLLNHFPYSHPREIQKQALQTLQDNINNYDVFVLNAPTAFGKTAVARTLMDAWRSVSVVTPTNQLVSQFLDEFPNTPTLSRLDSYICDEWQRPCSMTRARLMKFCKGCTCSNELATAKYRKGPGIYNYHTYMSHKLYREVLVVDEAHNLIPVIRERLAQRIWQHDYHYPSNMYRPDQVLAWINSLPESKQNHKKIQILKEAALYDCPQFVFQRTEEEFNGKGTLRGQPEPRDCIKLLPVDISNAPAIFWPKEVEKIILMSATIGSKDVEAMGLGRGKRVCYINCASPIPPHSRPIIPLDLFPVNRQFLSQPDNIEAIANEIQGITTHHQGEKGVIHVTYQLSKQLRGILNDSRYMFHEQHNKAAVYKQFRESTIDSVLIACGMYEGVDLPEDLGRWQVIAKVPWPSLGSPAISHLAKLDPEWYLWECLKIFMQGCGRVCRTPEDYGITYCLDSSFNRLYNEGLHLMPDWFKDALE